MKLYAGLDLHSNNTFVGILGEDRKRQKKSRLANDPELILRFLEPYREDIVGIAVESTYNWYWLVDALMDEGYKVHLANTAAIRKYSGLKHCDDGDDAFWLAEMTQLRILPQGYIYPKEQRPVRDLLRKRSHLVRLRTSLITGLQTIVSRNCGIKLSSNDIKRITQDRVSPLLMEPIELSLAGSASKEIIDCLGTQIRRIESCVERSARSQEPYPHLLTIPGVGKILGLTILLETGPIARFASVGNYASYCRKVPSKWTSNGKTKGKGNMKNGNKYLAWAFSEAAELSKRYDDTVRSYYNRKQRKTNRMIAHSAVANKLARAAYYIMRDEVAFQPDKLFR